MEPGAARCGGFCGHSFGARLTQAVAGEAYPDLPANSLATARDGRPRAAAHDGRPRAFIAFSPGFGAREGSGDAARDAANDAAARARFGAIERPFLCITGTRDDAVIAGDVTNATRRAVYRGLAAGHKAQLVLDGADHMTFAGQNIPPLRGRLLQREAGAEARQPAHHALVARVTTDWWLAELTDDARARARLAAPVGVSSGDLWEQG